MNHTIDYSIHPATIRRMADITVAQMAVRLGVATVTLKRHIHVTKKLANFGRLINPRTRVYDPAEEAPMREILQSLQAGRPTTAGQPASLARQAQALALFMDKDKNLTFDQIAKALGYADGSGAKRAVLAAQRRAKKSKRTKK